MKKYICIEIYQLDTYIRMILDLGLTPYVVVNVENVTRSYELPLESNANEIVLNVAPRAINNWYIDYQEGFISFLTRFSGQERTIAFPSESVKGVYAMEEPRLQFGHSNELTFVARDGEISQPSFLSDATSSSNEGHLPPEGTPTSDVKSSTRPTGKPFLTIVK